MMDEHSLLFWNIVCFGTYLCHSVDLASHDEPAAWTHGQTNSVDSSTPSEIAPQVPLLYLRTAPRQTYLTAWSRGNSSWFTF